jgi:hypothetical protein
MKRHAYARGWRAGALLVLLGVPGLLSALLVLPDVPGVPRVALLLQPLILLVVLAFAGAAAAPRAGFRSLLLDRVAGRGDWPGLAHWRRPALIGCALGIALAVTDVVTTPIWRTGATPPNVVEGWQPVLLIPGMLYGGMTEEIMMRFGAMSLFAWLFGWRMSGAKAELAGWLGNVGAAILFGALHLPAVAGTGADITAAIAIRTIGLNALGGLTYGWLLLRRDLESAMLAHAATHLGFAAAALGWRAYA